MISEHNKDLLNKLEGTLKEQMIWSARNYTDVIREVVDSSRSVKQFIVGLSVAILGLVFPALINHESQISINYFIVSFGEFCVVTILGLISLISETQKELVFLPKVLRHHTGQMFELIKKVQEIMKIENNNTAGLEHEKLQSHYKSLDLGEPSQLENFFGRYGDLILYATFFSGFTLLIVGIFKNLVE